MFEAILCLWCSLDFVVYIIPCMALLTFCFLPAMSSFMFFVPFSLLPLLERAITCPLLLFLARTLGRGRRFERLRYVGCTTCGEQEWHP